MRLFRQLSRSCRFAAQVKDAVRTKLSTETGCLACWILLYFHDFNESHGTKCHDSCAQVSAPTWCERLRSLPCAGTSSRSASLLNICLRCLPLAFTKPEQGQQFQKRFLNVGWHYKWKLSLVPRHVCTDPHGGCSLMQTKREAQLSPRSAHLHTMPKESSFPAAEKLPLPGTVSYICNLIDHAGEATSWREFPALRVGAWPHPCPLLPQTGAILCAGISGVQQDAPPIWS